MPLQKSHRTATYLKHPTTNSAIQSAELTGRDAVFSAATAGRIIIPNNPQAAMAGVFVICFLDFFKLFFPFLALSQLKMVLFNTMLTELACFCCYKLTASFLHFQLHTSLITKSQVTSTHPHSVPSAESPVWRRISFGAPEGLHNYV